MMDATSCLEMTSHFFSALRLQYCGRINRLDDAAGAR